MFCPNCGKQTRDEDNFCRYCGTDLRVEESSTESFVEHNAANTLQEDENVLDEIFDETEKFSEPYNPKEQEEDFKEIEEELVLYEIKKHWMSLFWPAFLTPVFLAYFWNIFLNTHSIFSWIIVFIMLALIIYPSLRYKSDKFVITNKFAHIRAGARKVKEIDIPISKFEIFDVRQTSVGKMLGYGMIAFCLNSEKYEYKYIDLPEYAKYIFENPKKFIKESL